MKKRFISKLLMAALVVVTMGVFSSCKDYDDDINANTALINQLQTQVKALEEAKASLESKLSALENDLNGKIKAAEDKAANDLKVAKDALEKAIADGDAAAIEEAQKRINEAEARILDAAAKTAENLAAQAANTAKQEMLDELKKEVLRLDQALADRYTKAEIDELLKGYVTTGKLQEAVDGLTNDISKLRDELKANGEEDAKLKARVDEIYDRAIAGGEIDKAIAKVATDLSAVDSKLNTLINDDQAKENAGFATLVGLNQAWDQIRINDAAIKKLQEFETNFNENILPTLAEKKELQELELALKELIDAKASKAELAAAVAELEEKLATKTELANAVEGIKTLLQTDYVSKSELTTALNTLEGKITLAYTEYTDGKIAALKSELVGIMDAKIQANNTVLKNEIYGVVDTKISTALAKYTTTESLLQMLSDYAKKSDVSSEIDKFYNEKLADKMQELSQISAKLAEMDEALAGLMVDLSELEDFPVEENSRMNAESGSASSISVLVQYLKALNAKIVNIHTYIDQTFAAVSSELDAITLFINKNITSLVTKPSYWTYGFPTIEATIIEAQPTYKFDKGQGAQLGGLVSKYSEEAGYVGDANNPTLSGYAFDMTANYWVNPTSLDKDFLKDNYTFWFEEVAAKNYITRNNENADTAGFKFVKFDKYENGVLTVKFQFKNGEHVNNAITKYDAAYLTDGTQTDGTWNEHWLSQGDDAAYSVNPSYAWTTTIALRAIRTNTDDENTAGIDDNRIVRSDYAIVYPTYLNHLLLGNSEYNGEHAEEGNMKWHLNTTYAGAVRDDHAGLYSFVISRDENDKVIDFNDYIDVHYNGCEDVWDYDKAHNEKGFEFVYTLLTNDDVWNLPKGDSKISIKEGKNVAENTGEDKAAIVRVELIADGKTYAYGYVTVLMENTSLDVEVETDLTLNCEYDEQGNLLPFTASASWDGLLSKIKEGLGQDIDWSLCEFVIDDEDESYAKFDEKTSTAVSSTIVGSINKVNDKLAWQFTEEDVLDAFYTDGKPNNTENYSAWIRIVPNERGEAQGFAQINIKVTITKVTYPSGTFSEDGSDRIKSNWFKMFSNEKTETPAERYEIHVNDEAPGETGADNEIKYDVTSAFVKNTFKFTADEGFDINDKADLFFNAERYFIYNGTNGTAWSATADYILTGASGSKYVMYLLDESLAEGAAPYTSLFAAKIVDGTAVFANATDSVAVLSGTHNEVVTFKEFDNAKDLLNHARHDELGENRTFTSHMIMHTVGNCLPVDERGMNTFDIRYLRPISANVAGQKKVYDAKDDGNKIWVADLVSFIDWRKHEFAASDAIVKVPDGQPATTWTGYQYMKYYGITTIKADFAEARSNVHTGTLDQILDADGKVAYPEKWATIKSITSKINFYPDENAEKINNDGTADNNTGWSDTYADEFDADHNLTGGFKFANGYYLYENNSGGTTDFYIILPVSVVYYWGETQPEWILIEVKGTEGQGNHARQN